MKHFRLIIDQVDEEGNHIKGLMGHCREIAVSEESIERGMAMQEMRHFLTEWPDEFIKHLVEGAPCPCCEEN